jgi:hypothetical protein
MKLNSNLMVRKEKHKVLKENKPRILRVFFMRLVVACLSKGSQLNSNHSQREQAKLDLVIQ